MLPGLSRAEPAGDERQNALKAVFVYKFSLYVTWPETSKMKPLRICVLGDDPLRGALDAVAEKKAAQDQAIRVTTYRAAEECVGCHILVVPRGQSARIPEVLRALKGRAVLTVGDGEGAAAAGLAMGFVIRDGRLRFEVNTQALKATGLVASSRLLKLALRVGED